MNKGRSNREWEIKEGEVESGKGDRKEGGRGGGEGGGRGEGDLTVMFLLSKNS